MINNTKIKATENTEDTEKNIFSQITQITQILAACLAAARQSTPPGNFCSREAAKPRRKPQRAVFEHEHEESPGGISVARAFQPEFCAAKHSTGVFDCTNSFSPGRLAPSPPTPLPRFTGARGGFCVFGCCGKRNSTPRPWKGRATVFV